MIQLRIISAANVVLSKEVARTDEEACDIHAGMLMDLLPGEEIQTEKLD